MTNRTDVLDLAAQMNCTVEDYGVSSEQRGEIVIEAPDGHVFVDGACMTIVSDFGRDCDPFDHDRYVPKSDAWSDLLDRLKCGLELDTKS